MERHVRSRLGHGLVMTVGLAVVLGGLPMREPAARRACAAELTAKRVNHSIEAARNYLVRKQQANGSWESEGGGGSFRVGITSLVMMSLLNAGMTVQDPPIQKGLKFLREHGNDRTVPSMTYEVSLLIMALATAKDGSKDKPIVLKLVRKLEEAQVKAGAQVGSWDYPAGGGGILQLGGDRSNGQFAVLALREAQEMGVPVSLNTWKLAREHWRKGQNADGGWNYRAGEGGASTGSMTVAGIATMVITDAMLQLADKDLLPDGSPNCCQDLQPDKTLEDALKWMGRNFSVARNVNSNSWLFYYLYGMERAGRLSGRRFFGEGNNRHDWYREGAEFLIDRQQQKSGEWRGTGNLEGDPIVATSMALLFLSKGLAPVLVNKLDYTSAPGGEAAPNQQPWNLHRKDVSNLVQYISNLPKWPKLLNWQVVALAEASPGDLSQAPVLFLSGNEPLALKDNDVDKIKEYIANGGFIFASNSCKSAAFDESFRQLVKQMYPTGEATFKQLGAEHPVFRSEYLIDPQTVELWGVDVGCRTSIIYSPHDLSCLWDKWTSFEIPKRTPQAQTMITKSMRVGTNVVAYATGREPANKLESDERRHEEGKQDSIERGFLQIAKIRHTGGWDAAPQALRNLLLALNKTVGMAATTKTRDLAASDPNVFTYPLLYMHGRNDFQLNKQEVTRLREYVQRGGVLFADSCCSSSTFDRSFRQLCEQLFPEQKLKRIPADHELFTAAIGHDLKRVKRREVEINTTDAALRTVVRDVEPYLEGIELNGRYVIIYSKYDISCALERQSSVACTGYLHDDAVKLAINIVLYALLQ